MNRALFRTSCCSRGSDLLFVLRVLWTASKAVARGEGKDLLHGLMGYTA